MTTVFERRMEQLVSSGTPSAVAGGLKGIEKESLRVGIDGYLSDRPHPAALGSALTNQYITTDFSEALLEFVTPAYEHTWQALRTLCDIHQFTYERLDDEVLWVASMPCVLRPDKEVPLAQYGSSNVGQMKTIYRNGLGYRYGRPMQTIAGIHFNYSLPKDFWPVFEEMENFQGDSNEFRSAAYLGLIRNFRRMGWLVLYLFGASPALCKSFAGNAPLKMPSLDDDTFYQPYATSLRMSDLGYSNNTQSSIQISLSNLAEYIDNLCGAMSTPVEAYEEIGTKVDGEYRQLSVNQLQIENEYYSSVRPKRVANSGERPTAALRRGGIEYVEIRSLDINTFDPVGISQNTMRFVEAFLIYCLLEDSPDFDDASYAEAQSNHSATASSGRDPELKLMRDGSPIGLQEWAIQILGAVAEVAELIDASSETDDYSCSVKAQAELVKDPERTPSARVLQDLRASGNGFFAYAFAAAHGHKSYFAELESLSPERQAILEGEAEDSLSRQSDIETSDKISLDQYLAQYFAAGC